MKYIYLFLILLRFTNNKQRMKDIQKLRSSLGENSKYFFDQPFDYLSKKTNKVSKKPSDYVTDVKKYDDYKSTYNYNTNSKLDDYNVNLKYKKLVEEKRNSDSDFLNSQIRKNNTKQLLRNTTNCISTYIYQDDLKKNDRDAYSPNRNKEKQQIKPRNKKPNYDSQYDFIRSPEKKYENYNELDKIYQGKEQRRYNYYSPSKYDLTISTVSHKVLPSTKKYINYYTPKTQKPRQQNEDKYESKNSILRKLLQKFEKGENTTSDNKKKESKKVEDQSSLKLRQKYKDILSPSSKNYSSKNQNLSLSTHPMLETNYDNPFKTQEYSTHSNSFTYTSPNRNKYKKSDEFLPSTMAQVSPSSAMFKKKKYFEENSNEGKQKDKQLYNKMDLDYQMRKITSKDKLISVNKTSFSKKMVISIDDFTIGKNKGEGKFGVVYCVKHKQTGTLYALKKIQKSVIKSNMMEDQLKLQIKLQSYFNHPNILKLFGFFDDRQHIYLLLEYMEEGTLFQYLKKRKEKLPEIEVSKRIKEIANAIRYLHDLDVAHRDIKPENIVLSNGVAKLCDFGWSTRCQSRRKTYCGTFDYAAPEILEGKQYDWCVDLWCLGVLTFELLTGKVPFYNISRKQTMKKILNVDKNEIQFPSDISWEAKDFVECLIKKDPHERKRADQLFDHPFLKKYPEDHKYF